MKDSAVLRGLQAFPNLAQAGHQGHTPTPPAARTRTGPLSEGRFPLEAWLVISRPCGDITERRKCDIILAWVISLVCIGFC